MLRISFENYSGAEIERAKSSYNSFKNVETAGSNSGFQIMPSNTESTEYEAGKQSVTDIMNNAASGLIKDSKDEMVVLSHTVSKEQYKEYLKDGNLKNVDLSDAVNIVDHIKMELIKGGTEIKGYTDTLDPELEREVKQAIEKASELTDMTEGMKRYFVSTGKELTIDNLYRAKFSAGTENAPKGSSYFTTEAPGYLAQKATVGGEDELKVQVTNLLSEDGKVPNEKTVAAGIWLVENSFIIDEAHIERYEKVDAVELPLSDEALKKAIEIAVVEGKNPKDADITKTESIYEEAVRISDEILKMSDAEVHATRVMEEIRLKMTNKANLMLIESGFSIDTKNLEAYVEALREVEKTPEYQESKAVSDVKETINDIKELPAAFIGKMLSVIPDADLLTIKNEGNKIKASFEAANIEYEKMFTEVRKDLGDSIKKAFRNVDDILSETGLEINESNRRAVRILGYNSMEITKESVNDVRTLDEKLTHVLKELKPSDTLNLIRKGTSPLNMSVEELNGYLTEKENTDEEKMEKYSKFLYKLERSDSINADERQQYIDVYRLLHQLEKTGYAAIGSLIKTGKELTFGNLKEAVKTSKNIGMDVTIDDSFGLLVNELERELNPSKMKVANISDNTTLSQAYDAMNLELSEDKTEEMYNNEQYRAFKAGLEVSEGSIYELLNHEEPVTSASLYAAETLLRRKGAAFKKVDEIRGKKFREEIDTLKEGFDDKDEVRSNFDTLMDNSKEEVFERAMESQRYVDVRELMLTHKQLSIARSFAENETYNIPMEVDGEMTDVALKIVHNTDEEPSVAVSIETEYLGKINARFRIEDGKTTGYIACNFKDTVTEMQKTADILGDGVTVVYSRDVDLSAFSKIPMKDNSEEVSTAELYKVAKRFLDSI